MKARLARRRRPRRGRREPFGKAGLILACCAIVLATTGAAFAAGRLTGPEKKEVGKIAAKTAKKYAGKPGATGKTGAAGPAGPAGAPGPAGPAGSAAAYATVAPGASGMTFKINSGFSGSPTNPSPGITCVPAPVAAPVALTLQAPGFITQVAPNQCGGASNDEVVTYNSGGGLENLPFNIIVP